MRIRRSTWYWVAGLSVGALVGISQIMGCSSSGNHTSSPDDAKSGLQSATGADWLVALDPDDGTVISAKPARGPVALGAAPSQDRAVLALLDRVKGVFLLDDPKTELAFDGAYSDRDGTTDLDFHQQMGGVRVHGGIWRAHFDSAGKLSSMSGNYLPHLAALSLNPTIAANDAANAAKTDAATVHRNTPAAAVTAETPALEIFRGPKGPVLAWSLRVEVKSASVFDAFEFHVDATSGRVLVRADGMQHATAKARGAETYAPYNVTASPLTFLVSEASPPALDGKTGDGVQITTASGSDSSGAAITGKREESGDWTDTTKPQGAAVSAQAHAQIVVDYYAKLKGKDDQAYRSFDGKGTQLKSLINENGHGADNAYWDGRGAMHYGDGVPGSLVWPQAASLDTVAHEITHGVTQNTSGLSTGNAEAYALNESMSDVFAALITHHIRNDDATDFVFSEDDNNAHVPVRSMINANASGLREGGGYDYMPDVPKDVEQHRGSNLPSHAFYLLTHGGENPTSHRKVACGIGWDAAEQLYWKLQTRYMGPSESFKKMALDSLAAAEAMKIQLEPIGCAWWAVGVLSDAELAERKLVCDGGDAGAGTDGGASGDGGTPLYAPSGPLVVCPRSLIP